MNKLLITGGAGFIGANFVHYWREHYPSDPIVVVDNLTYAGVRNSIRQFEGQKDFYFIQDDIANEVLIGELFDKYRFDTVVHFAAESHVDRSIHGPDPFVMTNIVGTHTLLKVANEYWSKPAKNGNQNRFHHISTDEVFGSLDESDPAFTETTAYDPRSPYSASKAASDHLVRAYYHTYGLNVTISNCSNNYGPYHFPEKLIPLTILNILQGKMIPVYGDGKNIRDWLYVTDHCRAIDLILKNGQPGQTYNIGGLSERNNNDTVHLICNIMDKLFAEDIQLTQRFPRAPAAQGKPSSSLIDYVTDRPGHDRRYAMNISKIKRELGFIPAETFETGLEKTVRWYLNNESWWQPLLDPNYKEWLKLQYKTG